MGMADVFSGISHIAVLRQEKLVQQAVHLQQSLAIEPDDIAFHGKKTPVLQRLKRRGETFGGFDAEFLLEVIAADMAKLELQHKFADEPLVIARRERAVDGQLALVDTRNVG